MNTIMNLNTKILLLGLILVSSFFIFKPLQASALTPGCYEFTGTTANITGVVDCGTTAPASTAIADGKCYARPSLASFAASSAFVVVPCGVIVSEFDATKEYSNSSFLNPRINGNNDPASNCGLNKVDCNIDQFIEKLINAFSGLVGVVVVLSIVIGGIQYASAGDEPGKLQAARQRITKALIALLVFIFLYALLQYIVPGGVLG